jgi:hypothetical protein
MATADRPKGHSIEGPHPVGIYRHYSRRSHQFVTIAMCYRRTQEKARIKNSIVIEVPAILHPLVWLNCSGQGYLDDVSIDATLSHDKGINRQCLCCRCGHRTQHDSEGRHPDVLKPSIVFHNLSCSCPVMLFILLLSCYVEGSGWARRRAPIYLAFPVHKLFHNLSCSRLVMLNLGQTSNRF